MEHDVRIAYEPRADYLFVSVSGVYVQKQAGDSLKNFVDQIKASPFNKVLVDFQNCHFEFDQEVSMRRPQDLESLDYDKSFSVALVFRMMDTTTQFYESVLRSAGIRVKVFGQMENAQTWLEV